VSVQPTPGPWFASPLRTQGANPKMDGCDIGAENGANVAIVLHQAGDREPSETIANANLIAAVPDLLAATVEVAIFIGGAKDRLGRPDVVSDEMRAARARILELATRYGVQGGHHTYLDQCAALLNAVVAKAIRGTA
jgi:hypothetical protein